MSKCVVIGVTGGDQRYMGIRCISALRKKILKFML